MRLVGGTDLALQYGHRKSVDIDLFGMIDLEKVDIFQLLNEFSKDVQIISKQKHINIYIVKGIKFDFVNYNYPWLKEPKVIDNIRLATLEDVAAMKLNAIAAIGSKIDFIDIELILNEFPLNQLVELYKSKYNQESEFMALKSMLYFADADLEVEPEMFSDFDWSNTKQFIKQQVENYLKN